MTAQPEALRLANLLDNDVTPEGVEREAAAELRRLHAEVQEQCRLNAMGQEREARLMAQRNELLKALRDAACCIQDWGGYASEYFQSKNDLKGDIERAKAAIAKAEGRA